MLNFKTLNILFALGLLCLVIYDQVGDVPWWSYAAFIGLYVGWQAYGSAVLSAQFFIPVRYKGDENSNRIAITFDDGPMPGRTDAILEILKSYNAPAAFFCIGNRVADNPEIMQRIHAAGHLIGNHSYWHKATFDLQTAGRIAKELADTDAAIVQATGMKPNFFRPPYGVTNPMVARAVKRGGYKTVGWSVRSFDTVIKDSTVLFNRITRSLKGGDVILLHDYSDTTMAVLPGLLDHIKKLGLKIVRVDELLNEQAYA